MRRYNKKTMRLLLGIALTVIGGILSFQYLIGLPFILQPISEEQLNKMGVVPRELDRLSKISLVVSAIVFIILFIIGIRILWGMVEYSKIRKIIGFRDMIAVEELASGLHRSPNHVRKRLRSMIKSNFFTQGHLNDEFTCLVVTDEAYEEYCKILDKWRAQEVQWASLGFNEQEQKRVQAANESLQKIRSITATIQDVSVRSKVSKMGDTVEHILTVCNTQPEKAAGLWTFLAYYIPLVEKMADEYEKLEKYDGTGANMETLRREIPQGLEDLSVAFEKIATRICDEIELNLAQDVTLMNALILQERLVEV